MKRIKDLISHFINGACMALADSVPGVSGGTVAFIFGFYDRFISSLDNLFSNNKGHRKESLLFLLKIGVGWIIGFIIAILFLTKLFNNHIYEMSSLFIGFIIFALPIVIKEEKKILKRDLYNIYFVLIGLALVCIITYLNTVLSGTFNINHFNIATVLYVFLAASIAISAMILPGMSGSTILLIFGLYIPIVNKVREVLSFNFSSLPILIVFSLGMLFGIIYFTKLLRRLLEKKRSATVYLILGMMLGSVYSIIVGPTTLNIPESAMTFATFNVLFFILGGVIILSLEGIKYLLEK